MGLFSHEAVSQQQIFDGKHSLLNLKETCLRCFDSYLLIQRQNDLMNLNHATLAIFLNICTNHKEHRI